jgi:hypothetical protein
MFGSPRNELVQSPFGSQIFDIMSRPKQYALCHPDRPVEARGLCRECYAREYFLAHKTEIYAKRKTYKEAHPGAEAEYSREYRKRHKAEYLEWEAQRREDRPEEALFFRARIRARKDGLPFTITRSDIVIPEMCPVLGIPLRRNVGGKAGNDNSPTVDKIIPALGYTPSNSAVISSRANRLKSDATSEELRRIADWIDEVTSTCLVSGTIERVPQ